jgi:hypothetical protein
MAVLGEELQDVVEEFRVVVVGHVMGSSWMCLETPQQETNAARPRPVFHRRKAASPLWGSAALGSPQRGEVGGEASNLQKRIYTDE